MDIIGLENYHYWLGSSRSDCVVLAIFQEVVAIDKLRDDARAYFGSFL